MTNFTLFAFAMPGHLELIIVGIVAVLLFGHRLPKIARSVGSTIVEFKKGVSGISEELDNFDSAARDAHKTAGSAINDLRS